MKKIAIIGLLSLAAAGAFAQGTLVFANDVPGTIVTHIYSPDPTTPSVMTQGNSAIDTPVGSTVYNGSLVGGATGTEPAGALSAPYNTSLINYTYGNNFTAQIYAIVNVSGAAQPWSSLQPVSSYITTLATSANPGAGFIILGNLTPDPGIPNTGYDAINQVIDNRATISLAAWYNAGGTINSVAAASAAHVPYGWSTPANLAGLGEPASVETAYNGSPSGATQAKNPIGITSFDLAIAPIPEPSTIALGVLGACAFVARRRKS
jgi:hypothetical protein